MSILVVMSDDINARLTAYLLAQVDQDVVVAGTLAEAQQRVAEHSWAAVIVDATLSDGSAFDLLDFLTRRTFEGAVVLMSPSQDLGLKVRALEEGADDYIVRPYEPAELLARMKASLRRSRRRIGQGQSGTVRSGAVELDVNALEVSLPGNRHARLTPHEMRLLHYLMTHAQQVAGHEELAALLFGEHSHAIDSNAVGVYIRRLRRKIEPQPDRPRYITTVRGSGYRFNAATEPAAVRPANA